MSKIDLVTQPYSPSYRLIALTKGQFTLVDTEKYDWLMQWKWQAWWNKDTRSFYARRGSTVWMAREIMNAPHGIMIDHHNLNSLDNRQENLRFATRSQNNANRKISRANTSGRKGVAFYKPSGKWRAQIKFNGRVRHLGYFTDIEMASMAYITAANELHQEFARY